MNKNYVTLEQSWTVLTECDLCGDEMEISELRYIEDGPFCDSCRESMWDDEE